MDSPTSTMSFRCWFIDTNVEPLQEFKGVQFSWNALHYIELIAREKFSFHKYQMPLKDIISTIVNLIWSYFLLWLSVYLSFSYYGWCIWSIYIFSLHTRLCIYEGSVEINNCHHQHVLVKLNLSLIR